MELLREEGGVCSHLSPLHPLTSFSDIIIMGSSEVPLRQEVGSCGAGSTRCSPATVLCRSDVVSRCSYLTRSRRVLLLLSPSPIHEEGKPRQLQLQLTSLNHSEWIFTIDQVVPCRLLTVSQAVRHNPGFSRRLGKRKQYCHTCWGFWDFSFVFLAFLLSTLPCC